MKEDGIAQKVVQHTLKAFGEIENGRAFTDASKG
jgi:hypothetical protein